MVKNVLNKALRLCGNVSKAKDKTFILFKKVIEETFYKFN